MSPATSPIVKKAAAAVREMTFGEAMAEVVAGRKVTRRAWANDDAVYLYAGYLHLRRHTAAGDLHVFQVGDGDLLGTDWIVVRET